MNRKQELSFLLQQFNMGLKVKCDKCGEELDEFGGLAFSPPIPPVDENDFSVKKYHICGSCWKLFEWWIAYKDKQESYVFKRKDTR